jgi:hypothetical protein
LPSNIEIVSNDTFAEVYLAYQLQDPVSGLKIYVQRSETNKDLKFLSHREHQDGLYEKIFNDKTSFEDMLCALYVLKAVSPIIQNMLVKSKAYHSHVFALFKVAFTKYLKTKFDDSINVNKHIIKIYEKGDTGVIIKAFKFVSQFVDGQLAAKGNDEEKLREQFHKFIFESSHYEKIKGSLEDLDISINDIESIVLQDHEKAIKGGDTP